MLRRLLVILLSIQSSAVSLTAPSDVLALVSIKSSITPSSIPTWSCLFSWNFTSDPCSPSRIPSHFICGITCSSSARILSLVLDPAGYAGRLSPLVSNLTFLNHLDLSDNSFTGPIPPSLSLLSNLQTLTLTSNSFSGPIPSSLSNLTSLTGPLSANMASMSALRTLDLSFNELSGSLPKLPPNLAELALKGNSLTGTVSRSVFGRLNSLEVVELGDNGLSGRIGGWFFLLPSLQQVDLANNSLTGVEVPKGGSSAVVAVDLGFNGIEGRLAAEWAGFRRLSALSLRHNRLKGGIPMEYGLKRPEPFKRLFLDGKFLKGKVPDGFLGSDSIWGSFGDNCLEGCPASSTLCLPRQKPVIVCRQVYGKMTRGLSD
ncbi:hypothetical protein QJS10_CPA05g01230 [Acorus calamus]|uniref:Uncharacterized protein n=1 Tax=Acorus calamus TaxID=4465 RepID=A0AAV9ESL6_ACOCL|nr:hypothetical protein QJS10_CPA05g01230 [Acorus calamus]